AGTRPAVRFLHTGFRRVGDRATAREPDAVRERDPRGALGEHLPLHRLPGHRARRGKGSRLVNTSAAGRFVGQSVKRREDPRLLTGRGRYVDDVMRPGILHCAFLRSDVARGRITRLDVAAARELDGVFAVLTAADLNPHAGTMQPTLLLTIAGAPLRPLA